MHAGLHLGVHVLEALRRERRTRRGDGAQRVQAVGPPRRQAPLGGRLDEPGGRAEQSDPLGVSEVEEPHRVGRPVVEHQRGLAGQGRHQPVPHHPARGREVEHAVAGAHVAVEAVLHQVLEQHAARPVDDGLGHARGARGVQHVQRVIERQRREEGRRGAGRRGAAACQEVLPENRAGHAGEVGLGVQERDDDQLLEPVQPGGDVGQSLQAVEVAAAVAVAVDCHEHAGADLAEAVDHAVGAEIGRARREHPAERGRGEHQLARLGDVGQPGRHAVPRPDARAHTERRGGAPHAGLQLRPTQLTPLAGFAPEDDGRTVVVAPQQVGGEVQPGFGEEPGVMDRRGRLDDALAAGLGDHLAEVPGRRPERCRVGHGEGVEVGVAGERPEPPALQRLAEGAQVGGLRRRRRPQRRGPPHAVAASLRYPFHAGREHGT